MESPRSSRPLYEVKGREGGLEGETERYVATILVTIDHKPRAPLRDPQDDLRVVSERAVHAAAAAYNWHNARIVSAALVSIEPEAG